MKLSYALVCALAALPAMAETAQTILDRMDASAPAFRSAEGGYRPVNTAHDPRRPT